MRRKKKKVKLAPRAIFENCCLVGFAAVKDVHSCFIALQIYVFCFYTQFPQTAVYLFCWPFSLFSHLLCIFYLYLDCSHELCPRNRKIYSLKDFIIQKIDSVLNHYILFFILKVQFTLLFFCLVCPNSSQTDRKTNLGGTNLH